MQAIGFDVLMSKLWEGDKDYDLRVGVDKLPIHNACHLAKLLFPLEWENKDRIEGDDKYNLSFSDGSFMLLDVNGGGIIAVDPS